MNKADFVWVLKTLRGKSCSDATLWGMTVDALQALTGALAPVEAAALETQRAARKAMGRDIPLMKQELVSMGVVPASKANVFGLADLLVAAHMTSAARGVRPVPALPAGVAPALPAGATPAPDDGLDSFFEHLALDESRDEDEPDAPAGDHIILPPVELDQDQLAAVVRAAALRPGERLLINAGPGAGKTTTSCRIVEEVSTPGRRVLMLVYNRAAETTIHNRLQCELIPKTRACDPTAHGCLVLTFDKFAFQVARAGGCASTGFGGYGRAFEEALNVDAASVTGPWDFVVLDEAQDMNDQHVKLATSAQSTDTRVILAGDPRQEVTPGVTWFSGLWTEYPAERAALRYNHRSCRTVVAALNAYSRAAFPNLHIEQVAVRQGDEGGVHVHWIDGAVRNAAAAGELGKRVGALLAGHDPADAYAIVPVTLEKYGMEVATTSVRQTVHETAPGRTARICADDTRAIPGEYPLATCRKIKGTERRAVVLYGADMSYGLTHDAVTLSKLLFVGLSRAQDYLHIVLRKKHDKVAASLLAPVIAHHSAPGVRVLADRRSLSKIVVPVASGLVSSTGQCLAVTLFPVLVLGTHQGLPTIPIDTRELDVAGMYAEALVAEALGVDLDRPTVVRAAEPEEPCRFYYDPTILSFVAVVPRHDVERRRELLTAGGSGSRAFDHATLEYSVMCGRTWTVTDGMLAPGQAEAAGRAAAALQALVPGPVRSYQGSVTARLSPGRPERGRFVQGGVESEISGVADLVIGDVVVELKFCAVITDTNRRQAATYAALLGLPRALVYNVRIGQAEFVAAASWETVYNNARAIQFSRLGREIALQGGGLTAPAPLRAACIFVDTESLPGGLVSEIGAVAVAVDGSLIDTFWGMATGVTELPDRDLRGQAAIIKRLTGLSVARDVQPSDTGLVAAYQAWADRVSGHRTLVHWAGNEARLAGARDTTYNAMTLYKTVAPGRHGLGDAARHLVPRMAGSWEQHRALDDALALMAVVTAMVSRSGSA